MIPAPLDARFVPVLTPVEVTFHRPRHALDGTTGTLLGAMYARGKLHHYRVRGGNGVIYFAPPGWLARSHVAIAAADSNRASSKQHELEIDPGRPDNPLDGESALQDEGEAEASEDGPGTPALAFDPQLVVPSDERERRRFLASEIRSSFGPQMRLFRKLATARFR
jgi:hypothetical protein